MPTWVAASPIPSASSISFPMRAISSRSAASKRSIGRARLLSTGSPYLRTCLSAASRRARTSGSRRAEGASAASAPATGSGSWAMASVRVYPCPKGRLLRIHVDRKGDAAEGLCVRRAADRRAHGGDRRCPLARLDDDLEALAVAQAKQRRGAEHVGPRGGRPGGDRVGRRARLVPRFGGDDDADQVRERRVAEDPPALELTAHEPLGVVAGRGLDGRG